MLSAGRRSGQNKGSVVDGTWPLLAHFWPAAAAGLDVLLPLRPPPAMAPRAVQHVGAVGGSCCCFCRCARLLSYPYTLKRGLYELKRLNQ